MTALMTEAQLHEGIRDLLKTYGWTWFHHRQSRGTNPGWPDLVLIRAPVILYRELKTDVARLRPDQRVVLKQLEDCGCDVGVWRPACLRGGRIAAELSRARRAA